MLTPQLSELLRQALDAILSEIHTCLPGMIESYDKATGLAQVKPLLMKKVAGEAAPREMGIISGVPVLQPRAGSAFVRLPVAAGSLCLLVFSERSLDAWLSRGGVVDPELNAKFHLNDAIAIPGLYPATEAPPANGADSSIEIANGATWIEVTRDGAVKVSAAAKVTLSAPAVNLGDEAGTALLRTLDVSSIIAPAGTAGGPCTLLPGAGTIKTKAS